ncbi:ubiquitin carboxyl-terminal hydrolase [Seminavis robusta]|uniref:Ubiquitin carboxyl-terminal hydrolase n=1 Tax=Seminavis robusta TaxID=568900 RepID=A0A9N8DXP4_9STRA|nr:ubiquitin carboxyl-terminal hydrolase [Seminavis robusta]|eukprot:Sro434_g142080.1 ubiquitin carboxyl-terminal hydrolase (385) ;mRNA; f:36335-37489
MSGSSQDVPSSGKFKPSCIRSSMEPDVKIVVGGRVYQEYSQSLSCWSGFFDRALCSGMKESTTKSFEFPDRKPEEWEWLVELMAPMSGKQVTEENVYTALSWFDELCCVKGIEECDKVLEMKVQVDINRNQVSFSGNCFRTNSDEKNLKNAVETLLDALSTSFRYNLKRLKARCIDFMQQAIENVMCLFEIEQITRFVFLLTTYVECKEKLLGSLMKNLPSSMADMPDDELLRQDLLPVFLHTEAARRESESKLKRRRDAVRDAEKEGVAPPEIVVEGAGQRAVNGTYARDGWFEASAMYSMRGRYNGEACVFRLFQCRVINDTCHWYISTVPRHSQPGTTADIDFYTAPVLDNCIDFPPARTWTRSNEGVAPPPRVILPTGWS